jgi:hypothetical protein
MYSFTRLERTKERVKPPMLAFKEQPARFCHNQCQHAETVIALTTMDRE